MSYNSVVMNVNLNHLESLNLQWLFICLSLFIYIYFIVLTIKMNCVTYQIHDQKPSFQFLPICTYSQCCVAYAYSTDKIVSFSIQIYVHFYVFTHIFTRYYVGTYSVRTIILTQIKLTICTWAIFITVRNFEKFCFYAYLLIFTPLSVFDLFDIHAFVPDKYRICIYVSFALHFDPYLLHYIRFFIAQFKAALLRLLITYWKQSLSCCV